MNQQSLSAFIWSVADLLRGKYVSAAVTGQIDVRQPGSIESGG